MHKETAMFNTESEAWGAIADTLEMIEEMPPRRDGSGPCAGLCAVLYMMWEDGLIKNSIFLKMLARIERVRGPAEWLAIKGAWKPRVTIARKFAKAARNSS